MNLYLMSSKQLLSVVVFRLLILLQAAVWPLISAAEV